MIVQSTPPFSSQLIWRNDFSSRMRSSLIFLGGVDSLSVCCWGVAAEGVGPLVWYDTEMTTISSQLSERRFNHTCMILGCPLARSLVLVLVDCRMSPKLQYHQEYCIALSYGAFGQTVSFDSLLNFLFFSLNSAMQDHQLLCHRNSCPDLFPH